MGHFIAEAFIRGLQNLYVADAAGLIDSELCYDFPAEVIFESLRRITNLTVYPVVESLHISALE